MQTPLSRGPQGQWLQRLAAWMATVLFAVGVIARQPEPDEHVPVEIPATLAGKELRWVIDVLNGAPMGDPALKFTPRFLELVPPADLTKILTTLRQEAFRGGKVIVIGVEETDREDTLTAFITGEGSTRELSVFLVVDEESKKIAGLRFDAAGFAVTEVGDWDAFQGNLGKLQGGVSFGAYEVVPRDPAKPDGEQRLIPIYEFGEEKRLAIGSTFKLYVLGALAEQVIDGKLAWTDKLAIKEELKSLPSGKMQDQAAGAEFTIAEFALPMIAISDNTATDHLIDRVGRDAVESYFARFNAAPERTLPFLTTREFFTIKLSDDAALLDDFARATVEERREMLAPGGRVAVTKPNIEKAEAWTSSREIERVEWFATAEECCKLIADFHRLEQRPGMEPLGQALRRNPGLPLDPETWKSIAFKGGSEPGVLNGTWLLKRNDDRWFALSVGWNDPDNALEQERFVELAQQGAGLLAREGKDQPPPGDDGN